MRPSWIGVLLALVFLACGAFAALPRRWSPDVMYGILAGLALYFVAFAASVARAPRPDGRVSVRWFGRGGIFLGVLLRALGFFAILLGLAFVHFDQRSSLDITWPLLILSAWSLSESHGWRTRAAP